MWIVVSIKKLQVRDCSFYLSHASGLPVEMLKYLIELNHKISIKLWNKFYITGIFLAKSPSSLQSSDSSLLETLHFNNVPRAFKITSWNNTWKGIEIIMARWLILSVTLFTISNILNFQLTQSQWPFRVDSQQLKELLPGNRNTLPMPPYDSM